MAPTILRTRNLKVKVYPKDHGPPHIHVTGPDQEAKFRIHDLKCLKAKGFSRRDLAQLMAFLGDYQDILKEAWNDYQD